MTIPKKIISLLLSVIMIMSVFTTVPFTANATETKIATTAGNDSDYECYVYDDDHTAEIIGYDGEVGDVTIPSTLYGYTVTSIGNNAFKDCTELTSVTIPDSVTSIGREAFKGCTGLTSVTIPNSVTSIGYNAFSYTDWYNNQPDGLVYAGKVAYKMKGTCPSVVVIKDGTVSISQSAFRDCIGLTSIDIPDSVTSIGGWVFGDCTGLTSVKVGNAVTSIDDETFYGCTALTNIDIPDSVTSIGDFAFYNCESLPSVIIPHSVTGIGSGAFEDCTGLTSITVPDSVTNIGQYAFRGCTGLTSVTISDSVTSIDYDAFWGCTGLTSVTIPGSVTSIGSGAFNGCMGLTSVTIPDSVTSIGEYAFYNCESLPSVIIPHSVTSIGEKAFGYGYNKSDLTIYGYEGSEAERYANDNGFKFVQGVPITGITVSGSITSYVDDSDVTVKLTGVDINFTAEVTGKSDYSIEAVPAGEYTLTVSKANHVTREYTVTVVDKDMTQDVELFPLGDVTGDGKTNVQDCTAILRYVRKLDTLTEDQLKLGDVTGDGKVNVQDVTRILRHVRKIETLY